MISLLTIQRDVILEFILPNQIKMCDLAVEIFLQLAFSAHLKAIMAQLSFGILSQLWIH